jgi:hypothetical protein
MVNDLLSFLIGPVDDLGPPEYSPLADSVFGAGLPLEALADPQRLADFREQVKGLPGPRVNGLLLPADTPVEEVSEQGRGFRFLGQRFTLDGYVMQQLIAPYVKNRILPLGLDVAAALGSETAYTLAEGAGATQFAEYAPQMQMLRDQAAALTQDEWLENTYGGWLWALKPLWNRAPAPYPPLMQTEAWLRRDLQAGLASWTELKHAAVLYAKQPTGLGGGGPQYVSHGYVEPNPLVFARIAVVAALLYQGITERGLVPENPFSGDMTEFSTLPVVIDQLRQIAVESAFLAEIARKELAGEPITEDDYFSIMVYGSYLSGVIAHLVVGEPVKPVAVVTDVASNPAAGVVLQEAVGGVDYIYVVIPGPTGPQLARGAAFSYYEFVGDINQRMTDDEWRALLNSGQAPPRPAWVGSFLSE